MCVVSSLHCPRCGAIDDYAIQPCKAVVDRDLAQAKQYEHMYSKRFCCEDFIWPPVAPVPILRHLCDECALIVQPHDLAIRHVHDGPIRNLRILDGDGDIEETQQRDSMYNHWPARVSERPHRQLTLRIPCCSLCKEPTFFIKNVNSPDGKNTEFGIEGIELEPNSVLWKWMWLVQGRDPISVHLKTGFISKPCSTCINLESALRTKVLKFVDKCDPIEAWAVWNWLSLRGSGQANFWSHETRNTGLPNLKPPYKTDFKGLISDGWKAKVGVAWEDIVDFEDSTTNTLPFTSHRGEPFTTLSQWNNYAGVSGKSVPVVQRSPLPLDLDKVATECEALFGPSESTNGAKASSTKTRARADGDDGNPRKRTRFAENPVSSVCAVNGANHRDDPAANSGAKTKLDSLNFDLGMADDEDDLFGDNCLAVQPHIQVNGQLDVESPSTSDTSDPSSNGLHSNGNGDIEMIDVDDTTHERVVYSFFELSEFGFWHLRNARDPNIVWHLPLSVTPNEPQPDPIEEPAEEERSDEQPVDGQPGNQKRQKSRPTSTKEARPRKLTMASRPRMSVDEMTTGA
ncbi:hypothetical protein F5Y04DRAFT_249193 [Hypomontagnella monticulosa]|nr:hypothetical protein F5Y04DRAFT_249193 [Hypomontagnella monticulosa]